MTIAKSVGGRADAAKSVGGRADAAASQKKFEVVIDRKNIVALAVVEQRYLEAVLAEFDGNKTRVAELLGIGRTTLYRKLASKLSSKQGGLP